MKKTMITAVMFTALFFSNKSIAQWTAGAGGAFEPSGHVGIGMGAIPGATLAVNDAAGNGGKVVIGATSIIDPWFSGIPAYSGIEIQSLGTSGNSGINLCSHITGGPATFDYMGMYAAGYSGLFSYSVNKPNALPFAITMVPNYSANPSIVNYIFAGWPTGQASVGVDPGKGPGVAGSAFASATPATKFAVEGLISCRELKVLPAGTLWPDYVFDKDYKSMSLKDIDKYIAVNKHLPQFKSAAIVEKEGITVGETERELVQAVEELYLHVIALQKENEKLHKEIKQLKK